MSGRVDGGPGLLRDLGLRGPRQGQILVRDHPPPHEALLVLVPLLFAPFLLLQRQSMVSRAKEKVQKYWRPAAGRGQFKMYRSEIFLLKINFKYLQLPCLSDTIQVYIRQLKTWTMIHQTLLAYVNKVHLSSLSQNCLLNCGKCIQTKLTFDNNQR